MQLFMLSNFINLNNINNSNVLVRTGFDIPNLEDLSRIQDAIPTIKQLIDQNNTLFIATKRGKIKTDDDKVKYTTQLLLPLLEQILINNNIETEPVYYNQFSDNLEKWPMLLSSKKIILYENIYFDELEKSTDSLERLKIAKKYAFGMNYFVDECFISSHRQEATNTEIKELLPWAFGISYNNEITHLDKLRASPEKPFIIIMGGAKLETKLPLITKLLPIADKILLGGLLCYTFIQANNELIDDSLSNQTAPKTEIYNSMVETSFVDTAKELLQTYKGKIILPTDLVLEDVDNQIFGRDIGDQSITQFQSILKDAKTVFWNGPMGFFENEKFKAGTLAIANYLATLDNCYVVLGGGDTNASLSKEILAKYDFVSMGGGATLNYLSL